MTTQLRQCVSHPLFDAIVDLLSESGNSIRKQLLILARNLGIPKDLSGNMYSIVRPSLVELFDITTKLGLSDFTISNSISLDAVEDYVEDFLNTPLYAGAVVMACCITPYENKTVEDVIRLEAYLKEIRVMDRTGYVADIDFSPFFGNYRGRMHHIDFAPNPDMAKAIHTSIDKAISDASSKLNYGRYSKKPLDSRTRRELKRSCAWLDDVPEESILPVELDRLRYNKRVRLTGGVEMKQRWYMNGVSPRTYYVAGATAFNHGRYLQEFFNGVCDSLVVTNRRSRVQPWRLFLHGNKHALFYDLTSFTSNLPIQYKFLLELGNYCEGIKFERVDLVDGLVEENLGAMIKEYAHELNHFHEWYHEGEDPVSGYHGQAGFLGVYGNIASANFIHGAMLLMLAENENEASCAGDDAVIITDDDDFVIAAISRIGVLAREKTFSTDSDAIYLKRKTFVGRTYHLSQHNLMMLPSFVPWMDKVDYGRFRIEMSKSKGEKRAMAISSLDAAFRSCAGRIHFDQDKVRGFFDRYYSLLGLHPYGNVPQLQYVRTNRDSFYPGLEYVGKSDYVESTIEDLYEGRAKVKQRGPNLFPTENIRLRQGVRFKVYGFGTQAMVILKRLGIVKELDDSTNSYHAYGKEGLVLLLLEYARRKDPSSELSWSSYIVEKHVPEFWPGTNLLDLVGHLDSNYTTASIWEQEIISDADDSDDDTGFDW